MKVEDGVGDIELCFPLRDRLGYFVFRLRMWETTKRLVNFK